MILLPGCGRGGPLAPLRARLELKKGNESYLAGSYDRAVKHYDRALAFQPDSWRIVLNRAYSQVALFRQSQAPEERRRLADAAIASFQSYLRLAPAGRGRLEPAAPDGARVEQHILTLYMDSGQMDEAVRHLTARLATDPRDVPAVLLLSSISLDRGDLEGAARWLRRRIEIEPDKPEAHYALGVLAWRVSYHDMTADPALRGRLLDEGLRELQRAIELRADYLEAHIYLNLVYRELMRYATTDEERARFEEQARIHREKASQLKKAAPAVNLPATSGTIR